MEEGRRIGGPCRDVADEGRETGGRDAESRDRERKPERAIGLKRRNRAAPLAGTAAIPNTARKRRSSPKPYIPLYACLSGRS
jgi:hypothetical protein